MSEVGIYLHDAVDEVLMRGEFGFDDSNVDYLIRAAEALTWKDPVEHRPEAMGRYTGRSIIPCMVVVAGRHGRKPRVTVAQRRWDGHSWVWSRHLNVIAWRELPDV